MGVQDVKGNENHELCTVFLFVHKRLSLVEVFILFYYLFIIIILFYFIIVSQGLLISTSAPKSSKATNLFAAQHNSAHYPLLCLATWNLSI
jgi:hypothetical protein